MIIKPLIDTLRLQKIDDEEYFSKKYSNYISNSRLSLINPDQDGNPEKFFQGFKPVYSAAFDLGSGVHQLTLQNDLFEVCMTVDKPTAKMGALADRLFYLYKEKGEVTDEDIIKEATTIDYYGGNLSSSKIETVREKCEPYWRDRLEFSSSYKEDKKVLYFDPRSREIVLNCIDSLSKNKKIQNLLNPKGLIDDPISDTEQAILLDVEVEIEGYPKFILKLKSKLDHYSIDKETNTITVNDVKTIGKIVSEMPSNIERFHYNREIAMYSWLLSLCAKKYYGMDNPTVKGNYLVVSTIPGHYTKVLPMTNKMFKEGWNEFKRLLQLVAESVAKEHSDFGIWI
jgi:hypothetical protein